MSRSHTVRQGECVFSIASRYGFHWQTLWDDPGNQDLKELRKKPGALLPNDVVAIPDKTPKSVACAATQRHRFRVNRHGARLRVRMMFNGKPIANEPYTLTVDGGDEVSAQTDGDGIVDAEIDAMAREARLHFTQRDERHVFQLGHLDPVDAVSGVKSRLRQLGYFQGDVDDTLDTATKVALRRFQKHKNLTVSGEIDDATRDALAAAHGY